MPDPRLTAIGLAIPQQRFTQHEVHGHNPWDEHPLIDKLFLESPVHSRGLIVPPEWYRSPRTLAQTNAAWRDGALRLGGEALEQALQQADHPPSALDLLAVTTVTGYTTPGLDLLLARAHGLREDVARAHFNCIGCHAAIPLLRLATDHVRARPASVAMALAVEICSACFTEDPRPENLVALSLFADGAAAATISTRGTGPLLVDFHSVFDFDHLDALGFGLTEQGFQITLHPSIPKVIGAQIGRAVDTLLARHGVQRSQVSTWCFHPGGSAILQAVESALALPSEAMSASRRVLRAHGNMSSPSVLFVLAEAMRERPPEPGSWGILAAFGPGLGIEAALLHFDA